MRAHTRTRHPGRRAHAGVAATAAAAALGTAVAVAYGAPAPPAPCTTIPQITDAGGDGHHAGTDVLSAWFSEAAGHVQAVIKVRAGLWVAEHSDAERNGSGFVVLFTADGQTRFVRATAPAQDHASDPVTFDYGTYTPVGGFVSAGATTGSVVPSSGAGTATVDVPAATGAVLGARLANPFVLTYDGITGGVPDWVDRAPGGTDPTEPSYGADYVVGSCGRTTTGTGTQSTVVTAPDGQITTVTASGDGVATTDAVQLTAPSRITGGGTATVTGRVFPARAGVPVALTRTAHRKAVVVRTTSAADGTFRVTVPIGETTRLRAVAEGIGSQELTVTVRSTVTVTVARRRDGSAVVTGTVRPRVPGRVLWLRTTSVTPSATTNTRAGTFRLRITHPRRGRYQAVVIPTGNRAERATSNTGVVR